MFSDNTWVKVFSHDTSGGVFTSGEDALWKNADKADAKLFSILSTLDSLRWEDGTFHLQLCYPELLSSWQCGHRGPCTEWTQTSNPVTSTTIQNFHFVYENGGNWRSFDGLGVCLDSSANTLICEHGHSGWCEIGARSFIKANDPYYTYLQYDEVTIRGPHNNAQKKVELYVKNPGTFGKYKLA